MAHPTAEHVDLEPLAADFVELLRDLGHLDDAGMERLSARLLGDGPPSASGERRVITLAEVRRAAAVLLFEAEDGLRPDTRDVLQHEWPRLFG